MKKEPKISIHLVNELRIQGQFDRFMDAYNKIHGTDREYANTILGCLEISNSFNKEEKPYLIIGGLAVMAYLYQVNSNAIFEWRGTNDIDILANKGTAEGILKGADYGFRERLPQKPGSVGSIYVYAKEDNGETTVVGLREGVEHKDRDITNRLLSNSTAIGIFSIPVRVPSLSDLEKLKRAANRSKDREDLRELRKSFKF